MSEPLETFTTGTEEPRAGRLLVATAALLDPNFARTVVLVLDHDGDGTLGVVLNRASTVPVRSVLPDWADACAEPDVLFEGGPVSGDSALALARVGTGPGEDPVGFRRVFGDAGLVDLDSPTEVLLPAVQRMRVFAGYSGWGAGQLDAEIEEGSWYVVDALVDDIFGLRPEALWTEVLRRQSGELAWVSTRPADPAQN